MVSKRSTCSSSQKGNDDIQTKWLSWCRLCAKRDLSDQKSISIFVKNEAGTFGSELATSIGKYFWVNIKADDEISQCLCSECKLLVEGLVIFTERVNKVQTLFCLLQNIKPSTVEQADKLRSQCGLVDEGWQHIIKLNPPKLQGQARPMMIDQQVQTDFITSLVCEKEQQTDIEETSAETQILNDLRSLGKNEVNESQTETDAEHVYEYVIHDDNEMEFIANNEFVVTSNKMDNDDNDQTIPAPIENEEEVQDSDLFKELKFKIDDDNEEERCEEKAAKIFKIISEKEEVEVEYQDSLQPLQEEDEDMEHTIEMLEEEEEDEEDYVNISENQNETIIEALELRKGKRGRPFGSKNAETEASSYRFECNECKRRYKNPNIFRKHMSSLHNIVVDNMPDFKSFSNTCSICSKQFATRSTLKLHMRHHLPDEEKYNVPCPYCDRKFSQVGAMRQHVNGIHHQMKPFICDQCGRACKTMAALIEHQLVHTNECPYECEVCHKRFKNKPRLKSHMDIHTKSVYKCPDCGLELNTKRTLFQHRLVHSDVKRFKCEFCDAAFKRSKALKNHLILHTGLRPYKCNFCDKSFSNGSNCRAHKKRFHHKELAEEEASGKEPEHVPVPKLEELKSAKGILLQPRKVKRYTGGLPNQLRKLLGASGKRKQESSNDQEVAAENYETLSDFQYEIYKSEIDESESLAGNPNEECEETVIYEIIDEI